MKPKTVIQFEDGDVKSLHKQDIRAPLSSRLSRGSSIRYLRVLSLLIVDILLLVVARWLADVYGTDWNPMWKVQDNESLLIGVVALEIGFLLSGGLYKAGDKRRDYLGIFRALTLANILTLLVAFLYLPEALFSRSTFLLSWLFSIGFVSLGRVLIDVSASTVRHRGAIRHPVFAFCHPDDAERVATLLEQEDYYRFLGWADITQLEDEDSSSLLNQLNQRGISEVYVCSRSPIRNPMYLYWLMRNAGITLYFLSIGLEPLFRESEFSTVGGVPCIRFAPPAISGLDFKLKRFADLVFAALLLVLASPIYLAIALLIKLDSPGPVFYQQTRIGLHNEPFKVWKFRTMVPNAAELQKQLEVQNQTKDGILFKIKDDPRITRVGRVLRQYSLDELPQVFNVILGEMSFVGPRPLPTRDVEKFSEHHFIRHEVLPGITGLWQVSGRSDIDNFEDVLRLDTRYIENWSLWLDVQIVFRTVQVILRKAGAY